MSVSIGNVQAFTTILAGVVGIVYALAKATPDEHAKVISWTKVGLVLLGYVLFTAVSGWSIYEFVIAQNPPSRVEVGTFVLACFNVVALTKMVSGFLLGLKLKPLREAHRKDEKEIAEMHERILVERITANVLESFTKVSDRATKDIK